MTFKWTPEQCLMVRGYVFDLKKSEVKITQRLLLNIYIYFSTIVLAKCVV